MLTRSHRLLARAGGALSRRGLTTTVPALPRGSTLMPTVTADGSAFAGAAMAPIAPRTPTLVEAVMKKYKPTTNGFRHRLIVNKKDLFKGRSEPGLTETIQMHAGRNNSGRITVRGRQAAHHRRKYRKVDFSRRRSDPAVIERFEYDPNRSAFIALIRYELDGELSYILAPQGTAEGQRLECGEDAPLTPGNALPIHAIPDGFDIHNIEFLPGRGGEMCRSAGTSAVIMSKDEKYVQVKLQSTEIRKVFRNCYATIGVVSNPNHKLRVLGKAGANRWIGRRPKTRGVAMNPVDHPMGGGEGKTSGGRPSASPWGWYTKGLRTRKKMQFSSRLIVKRRNHEKLGLSVINTGGW